MKMKRVDPGIWIKLKDRVGTLHKAIEDGDMYAVFAHNDNLKILLPTMPSGATVIIAKMNTKKALVTITNKIASVQNATVSISKRQELFNKYVVPLSYELSLLEKNFKVRIAALKDVHGDNAVNVGETIYTQKVSETKTLTKLSSFDDLKQVFKMEYAKGEHNDDLEEIYRAEQTATHIKAEQLRNNEFRRLIENFRKEVFIKLGRLHESFVTSAVLTLPVIVVTPPETSKTPFDECIYHTLKHGCYLLEEQVVFASSVSIPMEKQAMEVLINAKQNTRLKIMHDNPMRHQCAREYNFWWAYPSHLLTRNNPVTIELTGIAFEDYDWLLFSDSKANIGTKDTDDEEFDV